MERGKAANAYISDCRANLKVETTCRGLERDHKVVDRFALRAPGNTEEEVQDWASFKAIGKYKVKYLMRRETLGNLDDDKWVRKVQRNCTSKPEASMAE